MYGLGGDWEWGKNDETFTARRFGMKLIIENADNGYILTYYDPEIKETRHIAVEDLDKGVGCISSARLTQKLLWEIIEFFGIYGSKHDEEQIRIVLEDKNGKEIDA